MYFKLEAQGGGRRKGGTKCNQHRWLQFGPQHETQTSQATSLEPIRRGHHTIQPAMKLEHNYTMAVALPFLVCLQ